MLDGRALLRRPHHLLGQLPIHLQGVYAQRLTVADRGQGGGDEDDNIAVEEVH